MKGTRALITAVLILAFGLGVSLQVQAQPARWQQGLGLTAEQRVQIHQIRQQQWTKIAELNKQSLTHDQYAAQRMQINQTARQQIKNVLTPEQQAKLANRMRMARNRGKQL